MKRIPASYTISAIASGLLGILVIYLAFSLGKSRDELATLANMYSSETSAQSDRIQTLEATVDSLSSVVNIFNHMTEMRPGVDYTVFRASLIIRGARRNMEDYAAAELARIIYEEASIRNIDYAFMLAVIEAESRFACDLVSPQGAVGLGQMMPNTAERISKKAGLQYSRSRLFEPRFNVSLSTRYLASLFSKFSICELVAAAYNGGLGGANRYASWKRGEIDSGKVPLETRKYVERVMMKYIEYKSFLGG